MSDKALAEVGPRLDALYAGYGRHSIPPEKLPRALLLQVLYAVRRGGAESQGGARRQVAAHGGQHAPDSWTNHLRLLGRDFPGQNLAPRA